MDILYEKYKNTKKRIIFEFICQYFLLKNKYRNICQIVYDKSNNPKTIKKFMDILLSTKINYKIFKQKNDFTRIIIYNNSFDINTLDTKLCLMLLSKGILIRIEGAFFNPFGR